MAGDTCSGIRGWVGLTVRLNKEARGKDFASVGDRTPVVQSVFIHYTGIIG
jgi:hypothetical protein